MLLHAIERSRTSEQFASRTMHFERCSAVLKLGRLQYKFDKAIAEADLIF